MASTVEEDSSVGRELTGVDTSGSIAVGTESTVEKASDGR